MQRALDDRRPDHADGERAGVLLEVALAERLGHRVAVGPAEASGPLASGPDELLAYPLLAQVLGLDRHGRQPGAADVSRGLLVELGQRGGRAGLVLGALPDAQRRRPPRPSSHRMRVRPPRRRAPSAGRRRTRSRRGRSASAAARRRDGPPAARTARSTSRSPPRLVAKPSSIGGSKDTSPAQCTTRSRSPGRSGTDARSPSTTSMPGQPAPRRCALAQLGERGLGRAAGPAGHGRSGRSAGGSARSQPRSRADRAAAARAAPRRRNR